MDQTCRKPVSHCFGWRLAPSIPAVILTIALGLPTGSLIARNPANVVLHSTATGVVVEGVAVSPNNESVYAAGFGPSSGGSHLIVMNARFGTITADIKLAGQSIGFDVVVSPLGHRLYVSNYGSKSVSVVAAATNTVIANVPVGPLPLGMAISPDGKELWVANSGTAPLFNNGTVSVFAAGTLKPIALINVGGSPTQVVFEKLGKVAFVLNQSQAGFVSVIDAVHHSITVQNFGAGIVNNPYYLGGAILPNATSLYVNNGFATINNLLIKTGTLKDAVVVFPNTVPPTAQQLGQSVFTRDGKYLYVTNLDLNQVSWVTTENDVAQQLTPISILPGVEPATLAVSPDDTRLYVGNQNGVVTQIDITH